MGVSRGREAVCEELTKTLQARYGDAKPRKTRRRCDGGVKHVACPVRAFCQLHANLTANVKPPAGKRHGKLHKPGTAVGSACEMFQEVQP